jgi:hypothetical protein
MKQTYKTTYNSHSDYITHLKAFECHRTKSLTLCPINQQF